MSRAGNAVTERTFAFFDELAENNEREWFHAHKQTFEEYVRTPFAEFLEELGARLADSKLPLRGGAQTMFRINRDVRFTEDKRPYSESVSGLLASSGTKAESGRLLYLELNADGGASAKACTRPRPPICDPCANSSAPSRIWSRG